MHMYMHMHMPRLSLSFSSLRRRGRSSSTSSTSSQQQQQHQQTNPPAAAAFAPFDFPSKHHPDSSLSLYSIFPPPAVGDFLSGIGGIRLVDSDDDSDFDDEVSLLASEQGAGRRAEGEEEEEMWRGTVLEPRPRSPGGVERGLFEVLDGGMW